MHQQAALEQLYKRQKLNKRVAVIVLQMPQWRSPKSIGHS
jgi:hypothetical protein